MTEQEVVPELQAQGIEIPQDRFLLARRVNEQGGALLPDSTQIGELVQWQKKGNWRDTLLEFSPPERHFILLNVGNVAAAVTRGEPIFRDGTLGEFRDLPIEQLTSVKRLGPKRIGFLKVSFNRDGLIEASPSVNVYKEAHDAFGDAYRFAYRNPQNTEEVKKRFQELRRYHAVLETGLRESKTFSDAAWILGEALDLADESVRLEVLDIIERNIGGIASGAARFRPRYANHAYDLLSGLVRRGNPSQQHLGMTVLGSNLDRLGRVVSEHSSNTPISALCEVIVQEGGEGANKAFPLAARNMVLERLKQGPSIHPEAIHANRIFVSSLLKRNPALDGFAVTQALPTLLERYGLGEETIQAWIVSDRSPVKPDQPPAWVDKASKNLSSVEYMERDYPGISAYLTREYGIQDFGRYWDQTLRKQYRDRSEINLPYGVVVFPRDDHNGAFYQNLNLIGNLAEQLRGSYYIRIVEVDDLIDFGRKIDRLVGRYRQAISFALIGGHGNTDSITFGQPNKLFPDIHQLTSRNLRLIPGLKDYFVENPTIILSSCLTGTEGGIAEELAGSLCAEVIAPKASTGLKSLKVEIVNGKPIFQAEYYRADTLAAYDGTKSKPSENRSQRWWDKLLRL